LRIKNLLDGKFITVSQTLKASGKLGHIFPVSMALMVCRGNVELVRQIRDATIPSAARIRAGGFS